MEASLKFIGHIETPYKTIEDCPNNIAMNGPTCQLVLQEEYSDGLVGLQPGQNILILYWFENTNRNEILQRSSIGAGQGGDPIGIFALRSPHRPNPIGAATLPIEKIENGVVSVKGLDCLNGTKLIDVKPAILLKV